MTRAVPAVLAACLLSTAAPVRAQTETPRAPAALPAIYEVLVNGRTIGDVLAWAEAGELWVPEAALRGAGLSWQKAERRLRDGQPMVGLRSLEPAVTWHIEEAAASLHIAAPPTMLPAQVVSARARTTGERPDRGVSAFVNHSTTVTTDGRARLALETGLTVGRVFVRSGLARDVRGTVSLAPTSVVHDDERRLIRWEVGETLVPAGVDAGAVPVAGLSVSRQFSIDPGFLRHAPTAISGLAAAPAVAEVYVNGRLVGRHDVATGPFELRDIDIPAGAGDVHVVLRDDFGRAHESRLSVYRSPRVLRAGVHEFRYATGRLRYAGGRAGFDDTGRWIAAGEHRAGVSSWLTAGASGRVSRDLTEGGLTVASHGRWGEAEVGGWASRDHGRPGAAWMAAYGWRSRTLDVSLWMRGLEGPESRRRLERALSAGVQLPGRISVNARLISVRSAVAGRSDRAVLEAGVPLGRGYISAGVSGERRDEGGGIRLGAQVGWHVPLGPRESAGATYARDAAGRPQAVVSVQRSLPLGPGVAYRLALSRGGAEAGLASVEWQGGRGRLELRGHGAASGGAASVTMSGAVAMIGGRVHLTRPIHDAYALVRVDGLPGVRTYVSHQYVGRTDARGEIVVPSLISYFANRLEVDDRDVPMTVELARVSSAVAPAYRAGGIVSFPVRAVRLVGGRFDLPASTALLDLPAPPAMAEVDWPGGGTERVSLGDDGAFFFERAAAGVHHVRVTGAGRRWACALRIGPRPEDPLVVESLGVVACAAVPEGRGGGR